MCNFNVHHPLLSYFSSLFLRGTYSMGGNDVPASSSWISYIITRDMLYNACVRDIVDKLKINYVYTGVTNCFLIFQLLKLFIEAI